MKRNVYVMIVVSILFGLSLGIYDFILPFYLESRGVPKVSMGYIFAAGALMPFFLRIGVGGWSDAVGRKLFYWLSIFACAAANALSPVTINAWLQASFKSVRAGAMSADSITAGFTAGSITVTSPAAAVSGAGAPVQVNWAALLSGVLPWLPTTFSTAAR